MDRTSDIFRGFYRLSINERRSLLSQLFPEWKAGIREPYTGLDENIADVMIENCVGSLAVPIGIGCNLRINNKDIIIPMATEEPSIVAAFSGASKTLTNAGVGIVTEGPKTNIITANIQYVVTEQTIHQIEDWNLAIEKNADAIIEKANTFCPGLSMRGGGVVKVDTNFISKTVAGDLSDTVGWFIVVFHVNTVESMGANTGNTVVESIEPIISSLLHQKPNMKIVSNFNPVRVYKASFVIAIDKLSYKGFTGQQVAISIIEANEWAKNDVCRAVTHNKGIMNGIEAVLLATGCDVRAVEASIHAWAATSQENTGYQPLTHYYMTSDKKFLIAELRASFIVGTQGSVISANPDYRASFALLGNPDSSTFGQVMH